MVSNKNIDRINTLDKITLDFHRDSLRNAFKYKSMLRINNFPFNEFHTI